MIEKATISQTTINRLFPSVSDKNIETWWNGGKVTKRKEIFIRASIRYQANIEHASQQADHHEVVQLMKHIKKFYRRCGIVLQVFGGVLKAFEDGKGRLI